ncbi:serine/threonine-protein kinase [Microbacterium imperiale]|uniref:non-specific serine/threonine protein kinase n=1 Tax=Microbacterium imperiale TaxID=33884 RepID=A0A9W6HI12_9MICO|nr:serine/threonine-protein kinase [Microbacterium imperiale]MBP2421225.1 serine/threonine protein kinase [Microbacterium imperiale]MDS0199664.1 serine/threonine protein kinase [Microbacterium imperiale]BFE41565.1 serine/threonine-protein kinase [Microbacterium imperiale]GLJ80516.1 serine/threonine protein kinase [Microbacterium imperiale]
MSSKRPPAPPPQLPGFTYLELLGSGGFADVYLYEQHLPRRKVAVKVLLPERMAGGSVEQFTAEANVMAMLSTHPAIVTIYQAGLADDQRPYLVMENCPRPNLQVRYRAAAFSVAEALRVGIQVAAAVETAHRAGILHRDIKPANILVTEYNRPALTDFGIATTTDGGDETAAMSIPWSPPEAFGDQPDSGVRSDVYALGATIYTLLAGRSPFEEPGGRNTAADLIHRIETMPAAPLERADVPASLQQALARALAKSPSARFDSAVSFARALQRVQIELAHSVTPIDILDDSPEAEDEEDTDGELTRVRGIVSIEPTTAPPAGSTRRKDRTDAVSPFAPSAAAAAPAAPTEADHTVLRPSAGERDATVRRPRTLDAAPEQTVQRRQPAAPSSAPAGADSDVAAVPPGGASTGGTEPEQRPRSRSWLWISLGAVAAALVVAVVVVASMLQPPATAEPEDSPAPTSAPQDPLAGFVPRVGDLAGAASGDQVTFTWTNPDPVEGDTYLWYPVTLDGAGAPQRVDTATVAVPADPSGRTCIEVQLVRSNGGAGDAVRGCTP